MVASVAEWDNPLILPFVVVGFLTLSKNCIFFLKWIWSMFLRKPKKLTNYGSWSLITGCTDGIGKALAFELASKGLNLVLVSRSVHKLQATANEIWDKYGKENIQIKIIVIDFAIISGEEIEARIREEIEGLDVGVLVNNVGASLQSMTFFHEVDLESIESMVRVNVGSISWVTKAVIPGMLKKKKGVIVNIGSASGILPSFPLGATYASTKAFIGMLSRSLSLEYEKFGIDIQFQVPFFVATKILPRELIIAIPPERYSKASSRWIGYDFLCIPYWTHGLQKFLLLNVIPEIVYHWCYFRYALFLRDKKVVSQD